MDREIKNETLILKMSKLLLTKILIHKIQKLFKNIYQWQNKTPTEYILDVIKLGQLAFPKEKQKTQTNLSLTQITKNARCPKVLKI